MKLIVVLSANFAVDSIQFKNNVLSLHGMTFALCSKK